MAARWAWLVFAIAAVAFLGYAAALGPEVGLAYLIIYGTGMAFTIAARRRRWRAAAATPTANNPRHDHANDRADPILMTAKIIGYPMTIEETAYRVVH